MHRFECRIYLPFILYLLWPRLISLYLKFVEHQQPLNVWSDDLVGWWSMGLAVTFGSCWMLHIVSLSQWVDKQWMVIAYDSAKRDTRGIVVDSNVPTDISYVTILYARVPFCSLDTIIANDNNHPSCATKLRRSFLHCSSISLSSDMGFLRSDEISQRTIE